MKHFKLAAQSEIITYVQNIYLPNSLLSLQYFINMLNTLTFCLILSAFVSVHVNTK